MPLDPAAGWGLCGLPLSGVAGQGGGQGEWVGWANCRNQDSCLVAAIAGCPTLGIKIWQLPGKLPDRLTR